MDRIGLDPTWTSRARASASRRAAPPTACVLAAWLLAACAGGPEVATAPAPATAAASSGEAAPAPVTVEPHSEWAEAVLYFVVLDRFADGDRANNVDVDPSRKGHFHGGDLVGLRRQLDELAELGVTAIWITPVVENIPGYVSGAGFRDYAYHGYWADDFTRLDARFGTEEELEALVDDAHARGIAVLLDVVYNHVGYESSYTRDPRFRPWLRSSEPGGCGQDDLTQCLAGLPDLETELPEVRRYLLDAHLGLAERVGLDGFRLDTVKHVEHDFWRQHRREVDERLGEDFFLLGEVWGGDPQVLDPWFENDELDAGFDFGFQGSTLAFVQGRGRPVAYGRYLEKRHRTRDGHLLAHYLGSHDVPTALHQLDGDVARMRLAAFLQLTTTGIPTIYYGEEVGRVGGEWPFNRSDMPWGERDVAPGAGLPRDEDLRRHYRELIAARRALPALWRGGHETVDHGADHLVFLRHDPASAGDEPVLVVVHRAETESTVSFELPAPLAGAGRLRDAVGGELFEVTGDRVELTMPPLSGRILTRD